MRTIRPGSWCTSQESGQGAAMDEVADETYEGKQMMWMKTTMGLACSLAVAAFVLAAQLKETAEVATAVVHGTANSAPVLLLFVLVVGLLVFVVWMFLRHLARQGERLVSMIEQSNSSNERTSEVLGKASGALERNTIVLERLERRL